MMLADAKSRLRRCVRYFWDLQWLKFHYAWSLTSLWTYTVISYLHNWGGISRASKEKRHLRRGQGTGSGWSRVNAWGWIKLRRESAMCREEGKQIRSRGEKKRVLSTGWGQDRFSQLSSVTLWFMSWPTVPGLAALVLLVRAVWMSALPDNQNL